jgi:LPS-assembly protein
MAGSTAHPASSDTRWQRDWVTTGILIVAAIGCIAIAFFYVLPVDAQVFNPQWVGIPKPKPVPPGEPGALSGKRDPNAQMLVQASEIHYDYTNSRVSAVGNVQIYYSGSTLEADSVIYDQKTKRLHAVGNARLTEPDGKIVYGETIDLNDELRDGFVDSLRLETPDKTRFAAPRANRSGGNSTLFDSGVYTACEPCKDDPRLPPKWQVKAVRIIHDESEKMLYFENARLDVLGVPLFYWPYLSTPDPTVKRKSGFLMPMPVYSKSFGFGVSLPYYFDLAPNYDFTFKPTVTSEQGVLLEGTYRQRFETGALELHAAGIDQLNPQLFSQNLGTAYPGSLLRLRGEADTAGQFSLNENWVWGWNGLIMSDKVFFQDYAISSYYNHYNDFHNLGNAITDLGTSDVYLIGRGNRSYFEARVMYFYGLSLADTQSQLPIVAPVIDYTYTFDHPILGGEVSFKSNIASISRETAEFDPITSTAISSGLCAPTADPAYFTSANCLLRALPGTYSRASGEVTWKRTVIDSLGESWTPFVSLRADVANADIMNQPGVANFYQPGDTSAARFMPAVGVEYRYPFISTESWGTQTLQPIVQVIARPDEPNIGKLPNEDSQTLMFDDSNLFKIDKFAGWDRVEGGGRANYGLEYTTQFNQGGTIDALFGQSYQMFGVNSFAVSDVTHVGLDSGLDTRLSDYVARLSYQPDKTFKFIARFRFGEQNFDVERAEFEGSANFDRWSVSVLYGDYAAQPDIGFLTRREGVLGTTSFKVTPNWSLNAAARYDVGNAQFDMYQLGLGYVDECVALTLNYISNFAYGYSVTGYTGGPLLVSTNNMVMLQFSLRTLGGNSFSFNVGGTAPNQTGL